MNQRDCSERSRRDSKIEMLEVKLKAANRMKLSLEKQMLSFNHTEKLLNEELNTTKTEIDLLTEQLEDIKDRISETTYNISITGIQKVSEKSKTDSVINDLYNHKKGFDVIFAEERNLSEIRTKELQERAAEEKEMERKKQEEIDRENDQQAREAAAVEEECIIIEQECAVLKKRNNAIMLKLRRKLVETEDSRRERMRHLQGGAGADGDYDDDATPQAGSTSSYYLSKTQL